MTGPFTYHMQFGAVNLLDGVMCQRQTVVADVCFVHELSHYIRKAFDKVITSEFLRVLPALTFLPDRYITYALQKTFSNAEEFRNITGLLVHNDELYFDPISEAAYVIANKLCLRCSHDTSVISRAPIGLLYKIEELSRERVNLLDRSEVEYIEFLNAW